MMWERELDPRLLRAAQQLHLMPLAWPPLSLQAPPLLVPPPQPLALPPQQLLALLLALLLVLPLMPLLLVPLLPLLLVPLPLPLSPPRVTLLLLRRLRKMRPHQQPGPRTVVYPPFLVSFSASRRHP